MFELKCFRTGESLILGHSCSPPASSAASSLSKTKESLRTSQASKQAKQDTRPDESAVQSTEVEEEPTTPQPRPAAPVNRRPLSHTRSYHSIFSSVRGSVRNRGSSRHRAQEREEEKEEEEKEEKEEEPTTPPPVQETTTIEVVPETKEPDNNVSPGSEEEEPRTTETPSLKLLTPSPTKAPTHPKPPSRRPVRIRVHQKPVSKSASSSSTTSPATTTSQATSSSPSTTSTTSSAPSAHIQGSAASRKDYVASAYPETKNTYDKPSISRTKPSTTAGKDRSSQQSVGTASGRGSSSAGRTNGFGYRNGYSRRHPGLSFRGNSSRLLNGHKPAVTTPSRAPDQALLSTPSSATAQPPSRDSTQNLKKIDMAKHQETSHPKNLDELQSTSDSRSQGSTVLQNSELDATIAVEKVDGYKTTDAELAKVEEPTSRSKLQPKETAKEERSSAGKPVVSRTRINPSLTDRFPWLASRYPGMFSSRSRVSSSSQEGRNVSTRMSPSTEARTPDFKGTSTRVSGATGAAGVSKIQETSEDVRNPSPRDSLKNEDGVASVKPSLVNQNATSSDHRNPTTSSTSSSPSATSSSDSHHSRGRGHPIHRGTSTENDPKKEDLNEDNQTVETPPSTRRSSPPGGTQTHLHPGTGANGRVRSSLLTNRQFGGSRLPIKPQPAQNSRLGASTVHSSGSSNVPQPVLTSDRNAGSGTSVTKTGGLIGGNSQSTSSAAASSSPARDGLRGQGGRSRYPVLRGKPNNGGQLKPVNRNGKVHC